MKKYISILLSVILILLSAGAVLAAEGPQITMQPQNYTFPVGGTATVSVKTDGNNLQSFWFMEFEGRTYELPQSGPVGDEPWAAYVTGSCGVVQDGPYCHYYFNGPQEGLTGAKIWCSVEDGHYSTYSERALITVSGTAEPPEILEMPPYVYATKGEQAEITTNVISRDGSQLSFLWYETSTGMLQDIVAVNRGTEDCNFFYPDTSTEGTRYYVCMITTGNGGCAYSSVIPVTVTAPNVPADITTTSLPVGTVDQPYSHQLQSKDPAATWGVSYNPGGKNQLEASGLTLSTSGLLSGTPKAAGTYTFTVCAAGSSEDAYRELTLTVEEAPAQTTSATEPIETTTVTEPVETAASLETTPATEPVETTPTAQSPETTEAATEPAPTEPGKDDADSGDSTWIWFLVGMIGAVAIAVGVTVIVMKKKK